MGGSGMYHLTVYDQDGNKLHDAPLEADHDLEARIKGMEWLKQHHYEEHPYRIFHTSGRLIAFQSHKGKVTG
jgi:hypothetical protein